jgi:hypothetical protein
MLREIPIGGLLLPPLLPYVVLALLVFSLLDGALARMRLYRFVWHPTLVRLALFVALVDVLFVHTPR